MEIREIFCKSLFLRFIVILNVVKEIRERCWIECIFLVVGYIFDVVFIWFVVINVWLVFFRIVLWNDGVK